jgi:hypothetical protein
MKIETKRKIIWWVKRILKYYEYKDPAHAFILIERDKILIMRNTKVFKNEEIKEIPKDMLEMDMCMEIARKLRDEKILHFIYNRHPDIKNHTIIGTALKVIIPNEFSN